MYSIRPEAVLGESRWGLKPQDSIFKKSREIFTMVSHDKAKVLIGVCKDMRRCRAAERWCLAFSLVAFVSSSFLLLYQALGTKEAMEGFGLVVPWWAWVYAIADLYFCWVMGRRSGSYRMEERILSEGNQIPVLCDVLRAADEEISPKKIARMVPEDFLSLAKNALAGFAYKRVVLEHTPLRNRTQSFAKDMEITATLFKGAHEFLRDLYLVEDGYDPYFEIAKRRLSAKQMGALQKRLDEETEAGNVSRTRRSPQIDATHLE